jgi:hypothetical protein
MSRNKPKNKGVQVMQVKSLEKMEDIVSKNKSLSWEGWNVVELIKNPAAMFRSNAARVDEVWHIKNVFIVDQDGWRSPSKYVR